MPIPAGLVPSFDWVFLCCAVPPSHVTVKVRSGKLRPNGTANVSCESASSNPASRLVWLRDGVVLAATTNSTTPGPYGGIVSKSTLRLNVDADMNGAVLTCQASNDIAGQSIHEALTLEVLCNYNCTFQLIMLYNPENCFFTHLPRTINFLSRTLIITTTTRLDSSEQKHPFQPTPIRVIE